MGATYKRHSIELQIAHQRLNCLLSLQILGGCRSCVISDSRIYRGDENFQMREGCIHYMCRCNCDGSWECPGEQARDVCLGEVGRSLGQVVGRGGSLSGRGGSFCGRGGEAGCALGDVGRSVERRVVLWEMRVVLWERWVVRWEMSVVLWERWVVLWER